MENRSISIQALTVLAILATSSPLGAGEPQSGFSKDLKIRTAYGLQTTDHLRASSIGVGFNVAYGSAAGKYGLELGYYYKTGDDYIEPVLGDAPAPLSPVNLSRSGDSRRNQLDGFSLRLSFQRAIDEDWDWHTGLMVGGTRFRHEYVGDVEGQNWNGGNPQSWRDTYSGTPDSGGMKVSPYAGVSVKISEFSSLEFNLMLLSYSSISYVHHPGTAVGTGNPYPVPTDLGGNPGGLGAHNAFPGDSLDKRNHLVPHLELAYVLRF
jgi:hypothetical protein